MTALRADEIAIVNGAAAKPTTVAWLSARGSSFANDRGKWGLPGSLVASGVGSWHTDKSTHSRFWTGGHRTDVRF